VIPRLTKTDRKTDGPLAESEPAPARSDLGRGLVPVAADPGLGDEDRRARIVPRLINSDQAGPRYFPFSLSLSLSLSVSLCLSLSLSLSLSPSVLYLSFFIDPSLPGSVVGAIGLRGRIRTPWDPGNSGNRPSGISVRCSESGRGARGIPFSWKRDAARRERLSGDVTVADVTVTVTRVRA